MENCIFDSNYFLQGIIELKTAYKWVASPLVATILNAKPDNGDTFCINITFSDENDENN